VVNKRRDDFWSGSAHDRGDQTVVQIQSGTCSTRQKFSSKDWFLEREVWKEQGTLENLTPRSHIVVKHLKSQRKFLDFKQEYPQLFDYRASVEQLEYQHSKLMQMEEHPLFRRLERKFLRDVSFMNEIMEEIRLDRLARRDILS
jgi:hypothetical protein